MKNPRKVPGVFCCPSSPLMTSALTGKSIDDLKAEEVPTECTECTPSLPARVESQRARLYIDCVHNQTSLFVTRYLSFDNHLNLQERVCTGEFRSSINELRMTIDLAGPFSRKHLRTQTTPRGQDPNKVCLPIVRVRIAPLGWKVSQL